MKSWVVYIIDDKIKAVESDYTTRQTDKLKKTGAKILGYPAAKTKNGAIDYIKVILE